MVGDLPRRRHPISIQSAAYAIIESGGQPVLVRGKRPFIPKWEQIIYTPDLFDAAIVRDPDSSLGRRTGRDVGEFVVDLDGASGLEDWRQLCSEHGYSYAKVPGERTPGGGAHLRYAYPEDRSVPGRVHHLGTSIDVKSDGGQCVVPPTKGYVPFNDGVLPEAPEWLLEWIGERAGSEFTVEPVGHVHADPDPEWSKWWFRNEWDKRINALKRLEYDPAWVPDSGGQAWRHPILGNARVLFEIARSPWSDYDVSGVAPTVFENTPRDPANGADDDWISDLTEQAERWSAGAAVPPAAPVGLAKWSSGFRRASEEPPGLKSVATSDDGDLWPMLDTLFGSSDVLQAVERMAYSTVSVKPMPFLLACIAWTLASVSPRVTIAPLTPIQRPASLNFYAGIVGRPGSGKDEGINLAQRWLELPLYGAPELVGQAASGEALAESFILSRDDAGKPDAYRTSVIMEFPEITNLLARMGRVGSTLEGELCSAWMGSALGRSLADRKKSLMVPAGGYRFVGIFGLQPSRANDLFSMSGGGLPSRFTFAYNTDPRIPDLVPAAPQRLKIENVGGNARHVVIPASALAEIRVELQRRGRGGDYDDLDAHSDLNRIKVATGLSLMHGDGLDVSQGIWDISGLVVDIGRKVRTEVTNLSSVAAKRKNEAAGVAEAHRRLKVDEVITEHAYPRVHARIVSYLSVKPHGGAAIRRRFSGAERVNADRVLSDMVESGEVDLTQTERGIVYALRGWRW